MDSSDHMAEEQVLEPNDASEHLTEGLKWHQELFKRLRNLLFINVETVSAYPDLSQAPEMVQHLWARKGRHHHIEDTEELADFFENKAGLYAEFGRVVCIGMGYFTLSAEGMLQLRCKTLAGKDELSVLEAFAAVFETKYFSAQRTVLCAHNGKEFDYPFLCRRFIMNELPVPSILYHPDRKPWDMPHADTMEMWRFGEKRNFVSLLFLAQLLGIRTEKQWPTPAEVSALFWEKGDLENIAGLSVRQVQDTARVYMRLKGYHTTPVELEVMPFELIGEE